MKVNRRRFLQGTAAAAATGAFGSSAWAEDPINVASIHDLSGGLDIYGKPMVDAMTLAVEEANAADYNYGQITSQWVKKYVIENGGEVPSIDFFPLDVTNFGSTISKIQAAKPDFVWSALVGGAHISFYRQWAAAGMRKSIPMASTTFAVGNEHIVLSPDECNGMLVCYNYFQDLKYKPNQTFG